MSVVPSATSRTMNRLPGSGGTGAMGRTIAETIVRDGIHNEVILARTANPEKEAEIGARITSVDYSAINQLRMVLVDVMHNTATVPGSGSVPVVLAYSFDIAKFVVKALGLDHWEKEMYVSGDRLTLTEVVALAEKTKEAKFSVTHDSMGNLQTGEVCELPAHKAYYPHFPKDQLQGLLAFFSIIWESGKCNLKPDNPLNQRFPEIETATVGSLFQSAWGQD
ncbi:hypothetical protein CCUS01_09208 [Colletotrichum cuscutae]|uniref:Pyrroline-5-carboxylate reductase catalytic N-terminal domain-containing protein n=1 Tax=Colletotrichum cuscutae TaxID=1209917 RepID=A0AAI9UJJ7_9PEZI|nr:hypothetical protein CCUS01_09208 [Colletotrichum cuscutae]